MTRHQGNNKKESSGSRQGGSKKTSSVRGNAPVNKKPKSTKAFDEKPKATKPSVEKDEMRLNKYIANSGMCSRREADIYIQSGNVRVNGKAVTEMGYKVKLTDEVQFDGVNISPEKKVYILLNKPKNFNTSGNGSEPTHVINLVRAATNAAILPVGRMDKTTTGLLLLTNDNDMLLKFTDAKQRSSKVYQVTLSNNLKFDDIEKIQKGVVIDHHKVFVEEVSYIDGQPKSEVGLKLKTSNVKVVRNIFEHLKYDVIKVDRVTFAGLTKKNLPRGNWRFLTDQEVINLKNA